MKKLSFVLFLLVLVMTACTEKKLIELPDDLPAFIKESDFKEINWEQKAEGFGRGMIGNENKSGVIGVGMPSVNGQKWMWHLWGVEPTELTVVGYERKTETVHKILTQGWSIPMGGSNNGADAHAPSSVSFPDQGEWAILLYADEELFDILVYDIKN